MMTDAQEVLQEKVGSAALLTLNRPKAFNALNHNMANLMDAALRGYAEDDGIKAIIVRGAGEKAFCAGGDIKAIYDAGKAGDLTAGGFYRDEYRLNRRIKRYNKPYIAIYDGITMGGGVGVSVHGSHRIATDNTMFAMPEVGIGFFPDVGGTYFLPRLPGGMGLYLGLTGNRLNAADLMYLGLAEAYVPQGRLDDLVQALGKVSSADGVTQIINDFAEDPGASELSSLQEQVDVAFNGQTVEAILSNLERDGSEWAMKTFKTISAMSPVALKVCLRQLTEGEALEFEDCMRVEHRLFHRFLAAEDFYEGIRAAVLDKDRNPQWANKTLAEVTDSMVDAYFAPLEEDLSFD